MPELRRTKATRDQLLLHPRRPITDRAGRRDPDLQHRRHFPALRCVSRARIGGLRHEGGVTQTQARTRRHKGLRTGYRENAAEAVTDTKALGAWVVVAEQTTARAGLSGDSSDGRGARWRLADVVEAADAAVVIPMLGMANSLNVRDRCRDIERRSGLPPSPAARVSTAPASEKKSKSGRQPAGSPGWLKAAPERKVSYPQGSELSEDRLGGENFASVFWDK